MSLKKIVKEKWGTLDVVWIEDNEVPTYSVQIYFADGALSDPRDRYGEMDYMLTGLFWGTNRFTQKEISDNLEYFGGNHSFHVFHEYSTLSYYGLNKDLIPTTKKYCHLFSDSIYPKAEIKRYTKRIKSHLTNLVTNPSKLADRIFRRLTLRGTPFEFPVEGTLKSVGRIRSFHLKKKKTYLNTRVKKKLYLRGSKDILRIKDVILGECGWGKPSETFVQTAKAKPIHEKLKTKIVLIPVKGSSQAQIRLGRFLSPEEIQKPDLLSLMSGHLGGNFISALNRELRVKRGLVYSVGSFAQGQKYYGRSAVVTSSRNEKVKESLAVIKKTLGEMGRGKIDPLHLGRTVAFLKGGHLFQFESYNSFLRTLMFFDHVGRDWKDLYRYPKNIETFSPKIIAASTNRIFNWDDILIVIIGDKSLKKDLQQIDSTQTLDYRPYL
ncbi:MAG: insulinase family protein [Bacteriovoracales bacterium]|nr:insulinase family protein [Bacteriovoracales bacterium]